MVRKSVGARVRNNYVARGRCNITFTTTSRFGCDVAAVRPVGCTLTEANPPLFAVVTFPWKIAACLQRTRRFRAAQCALNRRACSACVHGRLTHTNALARACLRALRATSRQRATVAILLKCPKRDGRKGTHWGELYVKAQADFPPITLSLIAAHLHRAHTPPCTVKLHTLKVQGTFRLGTFYLATHLTTQRCLRP